MSKMIHEECWKHWEEKRLEKNDGRPPMPKTLPDTRRRIYEPPWLWDDSKKKYVPNVMSFVRMMIQKSTGNFTKPYMGEE